MNNESSVCRDIDKILQNKGWYTTGDNKNIEFEYRTPSGKRADYILKSSDKLLAVIEAKQKGSNLQLALKQGIEYAKELNIPIVFASDGVSILTFHIEDQQELILNDNEVIDFLTPDLLIKFIKSHKINTYSQDIIYSRDKLISIFDSVNNDLDSIGITAGITRVKEFCNILFLKIYSQKSTSENYWKAIKALEGESLLKYINEVVIRHLNSQYQDNIFSNLSIKNPIILKNIINKLDSLILSDTNTDAMGDAFEYFLQQYIQGGKVSGGQYFTPRHIVNMLVKLADPRIGETIYDPFCGTGGILIETFKYVKRYINNDNLDQIKQLQTNTLFGGEKDENLAIIAKMNMILSGDGHSNIQYANSLENKNKNKFDVVITNMPFSKQSTEYQDRYNILTSNTKNHVIDGILMCIQHCMDSINPNSNNGRAIMIIPEGALFKAHNYTKLRKCIVEKWNIDYLIALPKCAFLPYAAPQTYILSLKLKEKRNNIIYFNVKNDGFTQDAKRKLIPGTNDINKFFSFYKCSDKNTLIDNHFIIIDKNELDKKYTLLIPRYQYKNAIINNNNQYNTSVELTTLGEIAQWSSGMTPKTDVKEYYHNGTIPFIKSGDLKDNINLNINNVKYYITKRGLQSINNKVISIGSVLLAEAGNIATTIGELAINNIELCAASSVRYAIVNNNKIINYFLYFYLLFQRKNIRNLATGTTVKHFTQSHINNYPILLPSLERQKFAINILKDKYICFFSLKNQLEIFIQSFNRYLISILINNTEKQNWTKYTLGDVATWYAGATPSSKRNEYYKNGNIPFINIVDVQNDDINSAQKYITEQGLKSIGKNKLAPINSVIISNSATIGNVGLVKIPVALANVFITVYVMKKL